MSTTQQQAAEAEDVSFDLTGLAQVAEKAGVDISASPENDSAAALADAEKLAQEEFEKGAAAPDAGAGAAKTDEEKAAELFAKADAEKAAAEAAAAGDGQTDEEKAVAEAAKAEEDAKRAEADAKAAEAALKAKDDAETVHMRPSQKKAWNAMKAEREAARAEAAAAKAEADAAKARAAELEAARAQTTIPDDVKKELEEARQRVRELDAERDPEIVKKYDNPIKANEDSVIAILKKYKFDKLADDKGNITGDNPEAITALQRAGISFSTLGKQITALEKMGAIDDAEALRELLRDNNKLRRDRTTEVTAIKADVEGRAKSRAAQGTEQQAQTTKAVIETATKIYAEELGPISKRFTFLNKPAAVLPTDTPAVAAAKKTAMEEFEKVEARIGAVASSISTVGKTGQEYVTSEGRKTALAIQSVVLKDRILPRLEADLAKANARVKELEGELGKVRGAGAISRAHGAAAQVKKGADNVPAGLSMEEGLKAFAAGQGVAVNT